MVVEHSTGPQIGEDFALTFEIQRINRARQEVWGPACTETVGYDNYVLDYEASLSAFAGWSGNIHERHTDFNVGECIGWYPEPEARRIWAGAHVADPVAWARVEEGELRAFSVRGPIDAVEVRRVQQDGLTRPVRWATAWRMRELSLVPHPGDRGVPEDFVQIIRSMPLAALAPAGQELAALPADCEEVQRISPQHARMTGGHVHQHALRHAADGGSSRPHTHFHSHLDDADHAHDHSDVHGIARAKSSKPEKFKDVPDSQWGDPGLYNAGGEYRYPLHDAAHAANAAARFAQNEGTYTAENATKVKARINAREKELGVGDETKREAQPAEEVVRAEMTADGKTDGPTHGAFDGDHTHPHDGPEDDHGHQHTHNDDGDHGHAHEDVARSTATDPVVTPPPTPTAAALALGAEAKREAAAMIAELVPPEAVRAEGDPADVAEAVADNAEESSQIGRAKAIIAELKQLLLEEIQEYVSENDDDELFDASLLHEAIQAIEWFIGGEIAELTGAMRSRSVTRTATAENSALVTTVTDLAEQMTVLRTAMAENVQRAASQREQELEVLREQIAAVSAQNVQLAADVERLGNTPLPGGPLLRVPAGARAIGELKRMATDYEAAPDSATQRPETGELVEQLGQLARSSADSSISAPAAMLASMIELRESYKNPQYIRGPGEPASKSSPPA